MSKKNPKVVKKPNVAVVPPENPNKVWASQTAHLDRWVFLMRELMKYNQAHETRPEWPNVEVSELRQDWVLSRSGVKNDLRLPEDNQLRLEVIDEYSGKLRETHTYATETRNWQQCCVGPETNMVWWCLSWLYYDEFLTDSEWESMLWTRMATHRHEMRSLLCGCSSRDQTTLKVYANVVDKKDDQKTVSVFDHASPLYFVGRQSTAPFTVRAILIPDPRAIYPLLDQFKRPAPVWTPADREFYLQFAKKTEDKAIRFPGLAAWLRTFPHDPPESLDFWGRPYNPRTAIAATTRRNQQNAVLLFFTPRFFKQGYLLYPAHWGSTFDPVDTLDWYPILTYDGGYEGYEPGKNSRFVAKFKPPTYTGELKPDTWRPWFGFPSIEEDNKEDVQVVEDETTSTPTLPLLASTDGANLGDPYRSIDNAVYYRAPGDSIVKLDTTQTYEIHHNGGRPFRVTVNRDKHQLTVAKITDNDDRNAPAEYDRIPNFTDVPYRDVWIGIDADTYAKAIFSKWSETSGNTIIYEEPTKIGKRRSFVWIGSSIFRFHLADDNEHIEAFVSPIKNSDVPCPFLVTDQRMYLIYEEVHVKRPANKNDKEIDPIHDYDISKHKRKRYTKFETTTLVESPF